MILLKDGVRYEEWTPPDEATLAEMVKEHYQYIWGENSIYFDIRQKVGDVIPDGYVITFTPDILWVVEFERYTHEVHKHIISQVLGFMTGMKNRRSQDELIDALYKEVSNVENKRRLFTQHKPGDIHFHLSLMLKQQPQYLIVIDRKLPLLERALSNLTPQPKAIEFRTFCREGIGIADHIHQFEPLFKPPETSYEQLWGELLEGIKSKGVPVPRQKPLKGVYQPIHTDVENVHFEWLCYSESTLGVELHFEKGRREENESLIKPFRKRKKEIEAAVGGQINFEIPWRRRWARFYVTKEDPDRKLPQINDEMKQWAIETMVKFYNTCYPMLKEFMKQQGG